MVGELSSLEALQELKSSHPTAALTALHLSDLQFGKHHRFGGPDRVGGDSVFDTLLRRLTDDLDKLERSEGLRPDLAVITGDLAEWGLEDELAAVLRFCRQLAEHLWGTRRDRAGLRQPIERLLVIPGNHDINRDLCAAYFSDCKARKKEAIEPYWPKWEFYRDFFGELYQGVDRYRFTEDEPYTWFELPELRLAVAGFNSTMRESHLERQADGRFGHYGHIGEKQMAWFAKHLEAAQAKRWLRLGLVHHNVMRRAIDDDENLHDADILRDRLGSLLNIILHGHTHDSAIQWLESGLPVLSTGSAGVKAEQRPEEVPNEYQIVRLHSRGMKLWSRRYQPHPPKWVGNTRLADSDWRLDRPITWTGAEATFGADATLDPDSEDPDPDDGHRRTRLELRLDDVLDEIMAVARVRARSSQLEVNRLAGPEAWPAYARIHDPDGGTSLLGAHRGSFDAAVLERWIRAVHEPFRSKGNAGRPTVLVVETAEPLPERLRTRAGRAGVELVRRIEYENVIDVARWRSKLSAELDQNREYPPGLYMPQRLSLWSPLDPRPREIVGAADHLADVLSRPEGGLVLVLGDAGTGKTFLLREVARRMMARQSIVTPILISLRELEQARSAYGLAHWEMANRDVELPVRAFEHDLVEGRLALLFDGFDELAIRVRSAAVPEHFARILMAARGKARIVVASRAEHFISQSVAVDALMREEASLPGIAGQLLAVGRRQVGKLWGFGPEDVRTYLRRAYAADAEARGEDVGTATARAETRFKALANVHDLVALAANPRMLSFLLRLTDEQLVAAANRGLATSAEVYRLVIVEGWLAHQAERLRLPGSAPGPTVAALLESARRLAQHLWRQEAPSAPASAFEAHVSDELGRLCEENLDVAAQMVRARTLVVRAENGFQLVHQTVGEWLVADALAAGLEAGTARAELARGKLTAFMIDVLRERAGEEALAEWASALLRDVPAVDERLAENARLILARMGRQVAAREVLAGRDLRGQALAGIDLARAELSHADLGNQDLRGRNLRGASLLGARLTRADLRGADLTGADLRGAALGFARLDGARLGETRWDGAMVAGMSAVGASGVFDARAAKWSSGAAWSAEGEVWAAPAASAVWSVSMHPSLPLVASGHHDGTVKVWDADTGRMVRVLSAHTRQVMSVCWSPDGAQLASGSSDRTLHVWDVTTGQPVRVIRHKHAVTSVCWSPDGVGIAVGSSDKIVRVWDAISGQRIRVLVGHTSTVTSVSWSPAGNQLASASGDKTVRIWDLASGRSLRVLEGHTEMVLSVCWSPDTGRLASGSRDSTVRVWDRDLGHSLRVLEGHARQVTSVCWSADGGRLASGSDGTSVRVWDAASGHWQLIRSLEGHTSGVTSVCWSAEGTRLASGSHDETVNLWEVASWQPLGSLVGHRHMVMSVCWSHDGSRLAIGSSDSSIRVCDSATAQPLGVFAGHKSRVTSICWSPDGAWLASASYDATVRVWDATSRQAIRIFRNHRGAMANLCWDTNGTRLCGSHDSTVFVLDAASGQPLHALEGHVRPVTSVSWRPGGAWIASGSNDRTVRVWDAASGRMLHGLKAHTNTVTSVCWSPDGALLASGAYDGTVRVWDPIKGQMLHALEDHEHLATSVCWSPSGVWLASGSSDGAVNLWDPVTGNLLGRLETPSRMIQALAWHPRHPTVLVAAYSDAVRFWDAARHSQLATMVPTADGAIVFRRSDGHFRRWGARSDRACLTIGLAALRMGELPGVPPELPADFHILPDD